METLPSIGTIPSAIFRELVSPQQEPPDQNVLAGLQHGTNTSIVEIAGQAVSLTTHPLCMIPEYGWEKAAWSVVHSLAAGPLTCGLPPKYLSLDLHLPTESTETQLATIWETLHRECRALGITVITGHTGRYEGVRYPLIGGATMVGIGTLSSYISPKFIKPGDKIIITKGPGIEAASIFGAVFPSHNELSLGKDVARKVNDVFSKMSIVAEALAALAVGVRDDGISAMYSAAECGIWAGLYEMAEAAGAGMTVDQDKIVMESSVAAICRLYGSDPYSSLSTGALIIACRPHKADEVVRRIQEQGLKVSIPGEFTAKEQGVMLLKGGNRRPLVHPGVDPFWQAFSNALKRTGMK